MTYVLMSILKFNEMVSPNTVETALFRSRVDVPGIRLHRFLCIIKRTLVGDFMGDLTIRFLVIRSRSIQAYWLMECGFLLSRGCEDVQQLTFYSCFLLWGFWSFSLKKETESRRLRFYYELIGWDYLLWMRDFKLDHLIEKGSSM